jgi:hypothetical protein
MKKDRGQRIELFTLNLPIIKTLEHEVMLC